MTLHFLALVIGLFGASPRLGPVMVLEDPDGKLRIDDVRLRPDLRPLAASGENKGLTPSTYWLKLMVQNDGPEPSTCIVGPGGGSPHDANLYTDLPGDSPHHFGMDKPFEAREVAHTFVAFRLTLPPGKEHTLWIQVYTLDTLTLHPWITPEKTFWESVAVRRFCDGLYYGLALALIAFNFFIYVFTRDRRYAWYAAFQSSIALTLASFDRYAFQFLWPSSPAWAERAEIVFGAATFVSGVEFVRIFLETRASMPRLDRLILVLVLGASGVMLAAAALSRPEWRVWKSSVPALKTTAALVSLPSLGMIGIAGMRTFRRGTDMNARFFVVAWATLLVAGVLTVLSTVGMVSTGDGYQYMKIGSAMESVLLSVALASRINTLIRERERTQQQLLTGKSERLEALGRLVSGVAHEVGNPLNYARGGADELAERLDALALAAGPDQGAPIEAVRRAQRLVAVGLERIKTIIDNLRAYVRSREVEVVRTDLAREMGLVLDLVRERIDRQGVRLELEVVPLPPVTARPGELHQVLLNLIINALQAMPSGGTLLVSASVSSEAISLCVEDTGPGVAAENRELIFEPFFTTRAAEGGTGLGLAVAREIVLRHGGQLRVEGRGSLAGARFVIVLPLTNA